MAKQTFTTGQVLTAAQMTSLQQTAMGGGSATAKTASYVLVAADAGTTVAMNAAGATTITVNTSLFAAGDTVFIQNLGAGACTVTAGTATVATAGSLILPQNDAGILYFTATGASIFYDYIQAGAVSPLTTKGDVYTFSTSDARLGVGTNTHVLTADSAEATGLKWAAPAAGGGLTLLSTTALSGSTVDITGVSGSYKNLIIFFTGVYGSTNDLQSILRFNNDNGSNYAWGGVGTRLSGAAVIGNTSGASTTSLSGVSGYTGTAFNEKNYMLINIPRYTDTSPHFFTWDKYSVDNATQTNWIAWNGVGVYGTSSAISQVNLIAGAGTFQGGTVYIYGES